MGHSDADALLHAVTDAILGASGLGDIGRLFQIMTHSLKTLIAVCYCERLCSR